MEVDKQFVHDGKISLTSLSSFSHKCGLSKQLDDYLDLVEQLEIAVRVDMERFVCIRNLVRPFRKFQFKIHRISK